MDMSFLEIGAKYTRPDLATRWDYESHYAIGKGVVTPRGENLIVLFVTRMKQDTLTQYADYISGDLLHWEGQEKHGTDDRIINAKQSGDEIHLFYRELHHCAFEYMGRLALVSASQHTDRPSEFVFRLEHDQGPADDLGRRRGEIDAVPDTTEREELRKARLGQGLFGMRLLDLWRSRCAVTDVELPAVLVASHIKPWRCSTNAERLDRYNGLLLLPHYDKFFDQGLISFEDDGTLVISPALPREMLPSVGISKSARLTSVAEDHRPYFAYHRRHVFIHRESDD
jgi:hypothetical protein